MNTESEFHWKEGMKYALEGMKILFLLNGAATLSILTFIGNVGDNTGLLVFSMGAFAFGALTGPISLFMAYSTQLAYGNAVEDTFSKNQWSKANKIHGKAFWPVIAGILLFLLGVLLAGCALKN